MKRRGFVLIELLVAVVLGAVVLSGLVAVHRVLVVTDRDVRSAVARVEQAHFALQRMARAVSRAGGLRLPRADDVATAQAEHVRSVESADAADGYTLLVVTLDPTLDRDGDGRFDADDDGDGRIDEDAADDLDGDGAPGVGGVDDDQDGAVDEGVVADDDEDGLVDEDPLNGVDDDGDGAVDEDAAADGNGDSLPGMAGSDDDDDGSIDEGAACDDDEDGTCDEDGPNAVRFLLRGDALVETQGVPWDADGNGTVDAADTSDGELVSGVALARVERRTLAESRATLLHLRLELAAAPGASAVVVERSVRVGGAR